MSGFLISLIIAVVLLVVALWAIQEIAPPDLQRVLRVVAIACFLIWLVINALPLLGVA